MITSVKEKGTQEDFESEFGVQGQSIFDAFYRLIHNEFNHDEWKKEEKLLKIIGLKKGPYAKSRMRLCRLFIGENQEPLPLFQELKKAHGIKKRLFPHVPHLCGKKIGIIWVQQLRKESITKFKTSVRRIEKVLTNLLFERLRKCFPFKKTNGKAFFLFFVLILLIFSLLSD